MLERDDKYKELKVHICAIYDKHKGRYGYRNHRCITKISTADQPQDRTTPYAGARIEIIDSSQKIPRG